MNKPVRRKCTICKKELPLYKFGKNTRNLCNLNYACKECARIRGKKVYEKKLATMNAYKKPAILLDHNYRGSKKRFRDTELMFEYLQTELKRVMKMIGSIHRVYLVEHCEALVGRLDQKDYKYFLNGFLSKHYSVSDKGIVSK